MKITRKKLLDNISMKEQHFMLQGWLKTNKVDYEEFLELLDYIRG